MLKKIIVESKSSCIKKTGKKLLLVTGCMLALFMVAPVMNSQAVDNVLGIETAYASESTFSSFWFQDTDGSWKVKDNTGQIVKNCWLCDDAVSSNGQNVWYLLDTNGNMIVSGLVKDSSGNYYSLETNHNGFYGMLRYQSGTYDGINLSLESSHSGGFAQILNQDGITNLMNKYGVTSVSISNANCVYTSTFASSKNESSNQTNPSKEYSSVEERMKDSNNMGNIDKSKAKGNLADWDQGGGGTSGWTDEELAAWEDALNRVR